MNTWLIHLLPLAIQSIVVGLIFLTAYKLKDYFGSAVLYIILGLFRYLHIFITNSFQAELGSGILYSPASAVIYTALLIMVLLIYIKEDALEARKLIYAMIFANIVLLIIHYGLSNWYHFEGLISKNILPNTYFKISLPIFLIGTLLLFIESFFIIIIFEYLAKHTKIVFINILVTMLIVITIHTFIISFLGFLFQNKFLFYFVGGLISKSFVVIIYSILFTAYIILTKKSDSISELKTHNFNSIFNILTYRQKYEQAIIEKKVTAFELQKRTLQINAIFEEAPIGMAIFDYKTETLEEANKQYQTILGKTTEEIRKSDWIANTHPDDLEEDLKNTKLLAEGKISSYSMNKRILKPNGSYLWVNLKIVPFEEVKNKVKKYLVMLEDISLQKQAEEILIINKEKLEKLVEERTLDLENSQIALLNLVDDLNLESKKLSKSHEHIAHINEELKAFTYSVSHDLKAPLRAISQLSFWLSQDYADKIDKEGQKQLSLLIGRVKRLDDLIEGLLQYSRAGKTREKELDIDLNTFINEIIEALSPKPNITITIKNKLPNFIGDPIRLGQLFQNLIDNAIKYNDKQNIIINIGSKKLEDFYEFYIEDNGLGIEEKYFDRIFQIFQRLESRDTLEGTGIGLSLAKRIVQIYGGNMWVKSKIGVGTTFYFTLPIQKKPFK
jgi:PAS domain S-box-containing protein